MSLLDQVSNALDETSLRQISTRLGADQDATSKAIAAGLPLLLGALARNASDPRGAEELHQALARDHDGSTLDNPAPVLAGERLGEGDAILGHVLGDRRGTVEQGIARASGLDLSKVGPLLAMLAPLVLGALGRARRDGGLDPGGLANVLGREREEIAGSAPGLMRVVSAVLDRDRDGSVVDDLGSMLSGLFGKR